MVLFIAIERRVKQPMIDLGLFRNGQFNINLITGFMTFVAIAGTVILMPFYLENVLRYSPREVGLLLAAVPIAMGVVAPVSGSLSDRFGSRPITVIGLVVLVLGYYGMSTLDADTGAIRYVLLFSPIGIGMGIFQSPNNSAIMGAAPQGRLGIVSGLLANTRTMGQTAGIAIMGAFWAGRTFFHVGETLLGGATEAPAGAQVAGLQDTFTAMVIMMAVALALAVWALVRERRKQDKAVSKVEAV
jgi:MFS family permease